MNRLRLVVTLPDLTPEAVSTLKSVFTQLCDLAEDSDTPNGTRIHLHCLPRRALASLSPILPQP